MEINQPYSYTWASIGDAGPNHGVKYLTTSQNLATFRYQISPDLEDAGSAFHQAQCGSYSQQYPNGFISGVQLLNNTREHEFGGTLGHYQQYVDSQDDPDNNVGIGAEMQIAGPSTSVESFRAMLEDNLNARTAFIRSDTLFEACNRDVRYDTTCTFRGYINFAPYQPCQ